MKQFRQPPAPPPSKDLELWGLDAELAVLARGLRNGGQHTKGSGSLRVPPSELDWTAASLIALQRGLTDTRVRVGTAYMDEADALSAYLLFYWQTSHAQMQGLFHMAKAAIEEGKWPWADAKRIRILDLGSGPGPAGIALAEALAIEDCQLSFCDRSPLAVSCARTLAQARGWTPDSRAPWMAGSDPLPEGPFDFVILSHVLNELGGTDEDRHNHRMKLLEAALEVLAPGGALLLLEPALLSTSRDLLLQRDRLVARGMRPLAPCFHDGPCPAYAESNQSCHSEFSPPQSPLIAALSQKTGLDRSAVKSCCFFFMRETEAPKRMHAWRVVSEQRRNKAGRSRVSLCGPAAAGGTSPDFPEDLASRVDGEPGGARFNLSTAGDLKANGPKGLRPIARSDQLLVEHPEIRETGWGVGPETRLTLCNEYYTGAGERTRS